ncbi:hypothetical protein [Compostimonas suwonensis]|uniref:hypothetical protein n=1 Tax=Compostimonas suwonensis TaxID=1048394 RepID=UPI000C23A5AC|nr:hypothetical protein [Compostimonas suwonensis]
MPVERLEAVAETHAEPRAEVADAGSRRLGELHGPREIDHRAHRRGDGVALDRDQLLFDDDDLAHLRPARHRQAEARSRDHAQLMERGREGRRAVDPGRAEPLDDQPVGQARHDRSHPHGRVGRDIRRRGSVVEGERLAVEAQRAQLGGGEVVRGQQERRHASIVQGADVTALVVAAIPCTRERRTPLWRAG